MSLSSGNFASGMEMEIIPPIAILKHHPKCKVPLKNSEEKEAPVHTVWPPACPRLRCSQCGVTCQ